MGIMEFEVMYSKIEYARFLNASLKAFLYAINLVVNLDLKNK
jgi:hypothetical protein